MKLSTAGCCPRDSPQRRTNQLAAQDQTVNPENIDTDNIIWTGKIIFQNIYVYTDTYMHALTTTGKKAMNLKESREGFMGG